MIVSDACGPLDPYVNYRRTLTGTYTAHTTGLVPLEIYNWKEGPHASLCVSFIDNIRVRALIEEFRATPREVSSAYGGTVRFDLEAGPENSGRTYLIVSSASGTYPGFTMNQVEVPINLDDWTWAALSLLDTSLMSGFLGQLDVQGEATAFLNIPGSSPGAMIGVPFFFSYLVLENPLAGPVAGASHPVYLLFTP